MRNGSDAADFEGWVIRLEVYFGEGPVWVASDDVDERVVLEDSGLSVELVDQLRWWHRRMSGGSDATNYQSPPGLPVSLLAVGEVLAQRIADEVGDEFEVQLGFDGRRSRVRAPRRARNPQAHDFFATRARLAIAARESWLR